MSYDQTKLDSIKDEAHKESLSNKDKKFYVIWNEYGDWGYIYEFPVDSDNSGEHWVCYYLNGEEFE